MPALHCFIYERIRSNRFSARDRKRAAKTSQINPRVFKRRLVLYTRGWIRRDLI